MYYVDDNYISINNLLNTEEGFKKGNIFKNIYSPYNKYVYNYIPSSEREKLLIKIMEYSFYAHELNLYLDNYPCDKSKINLFNEYNNKAKNLINEYTIKYEPIILENLNEIPFSWVESPWPWEEI